MIGIVFATEEEAQPFLQQFERGRFDGLAEDETFHDDHFMVSIVGTGKIKATLRSERLLQRYQPSLLIHAGTCSALVDKLKVGSLVTASQVFEGDRIELAAPTYPRMPLGTPFKKLPKGTLVTQDHTVQGQSELSYWQRIADMTDMTGYAVAYVAATHGIPCTIIKAVTGVIQREDPYYRKTRAKACQDLATFLTPRLEKLKNDATS